MVTFRERRRYPRVSGSFEWLLMAELTETQTHNTIITGVENISRNGMCCEVDMPFAAGTQVHATLLLPVYTDTDSVFRQIRFSAKIMRVLNRETNVMELGMTFVKMSKYDNRRIGRYVEYVKSRIQPKRKRRTKAQMLAARSAADAAKKHGQGKD